MVGRGRIGLGWVGLGCHTFLLQRIRRRLAFRHIDYAVDIEGDFFCIGGPVLVAEAVGVFAVHRGIEGVVAGAYGGLVDLVGAAGLLYLSHASH